MKVLLLNSDEDQLNQIQEMLDGDDYQILTAEESRAAGKYFQEDDAPQMVVADFEAPGGGIDLINQLLALSPKNFPYVLFLTEEQGEKYAIDSLGPIPGDFMVNPVKKAELKARMAVAERAIAWQARHQQQMGTSADLAIYDELTNVLNRQAVYERALGELNRAQRGKIPVCLAMIELTNVDSLEADHGPEIANQAIRFVARTARANVRIYDLVGRWIGPKFFLMLPGVPEEHTGKVVERVSRAIMMVRVRLPEGVPLGLEIATGYTWSDVDEPDPLYVLIEKANEALEGAKKIEEGNKILGFEEK